MRRKKNLIKASILLTGSKTLGIAWLLTFRDYFHIV